MLWHSTEERNPPVRSGAGRPRYTGAVQRRLLAGAGVLAIVSGLTVATGVAQAPATQTFIGTTPCGEPARGFVGGLAPGAACHGITWKLVLTTGQPDSARWSLSAVYGVPSAANPNVMVDGPRAAASGHLTATDAEYRLAVPGDTKTLGFRRVSDGLIHLLSAEGGLSVGNGGWSYTLNRANQAEQPGNPSLAPDMSYTISPRATGDAVFGIFEGRTPCHGIVRELKIAPTPGCLKVKWRVTLLQNPATGEPSSYKIEGSLHRAAAREGRWRVLKDAAASRGIVYQLDASGTEGPLLLFKGDDNVLFFLNQQKQLLVGNADFSYTLNRVTPAATR